MSGSTLLVLLTVVALSRVINSIQISWDGPAFAAPPITPLQFLIVSSPTEKKVVWTTLQNFETSDGRAFALIDSGLDEPKGLAFDHNRGHLYIADSGAKKIFRYTVLADITGKAATLTTSGVRLTIMEGHPVEWVTVDEHGNLFYTAPDTNNINKIAADVLEKVAKGEYTASALRIISEKTLEAQDETKRAMDTASSDAMPTDPPPVKPHILSMYEAKLNPHVSSPAAIWADGADLYWTNQVNGKTAGTVVKGKVDPKSASAEKGPAAFPADPLTNISSGAHGLAMSDKVMFFSQNGAKANTGLVTGLLLGTDIAIDFVRTIATPRALVWDKDQTVYVADEAMGYVWSFPSGRMMTDVPLTKTLTMKGAYGLMILNSNDPAFGNQVHSDTGKVAEDEKYDASENMYKDQQQPGLLEFMNTLKSSAPGSMGLVAMCTVLAALF